MTFNLPDLLLGLIVGGYWARVLKMVIKQRRKTGRDANFVPREPLGLALRIIWYPVVVGWVIHPFINALSVSPPPIFKPLFYNPVCVWAGLLVAGFALAATLVCWRRMGKSWRMGIDPTERTSLVFTGPYAYVRHPIYALSSLMMLGSVLTIPSIVMIVIGGVHIAFLQWEASREEKYLLQTHGDAYGRYRSQVGRMIPRSVTPYAG